MKRQTDALQDTAAPGLNSAHRISIPTWKIHSGVKMQIRKLVPFMCESEEGEGERKITIIQWKPNPKCSGKATSCGEPGWEKDRTQCLRWVKKMKDVLFRHCKIKMYNKAFHVLTCQVNRETEHKVMYSWYPQMWSWSFFLCLLSWSNSNRTTCCASSYRNSFLDFRK